MSWVPRASVYAHDSGLTFVVEIPGVERKDVEASVVAGELTIRGQRAPVAIGNGMKPMIVEQPWGAFERRFPLPAWAGPERITAHCANGVLEICLSRGEEQTPSDFRVEIG